MTGSGTSRLYQRVPVEVRTATDGGLFDDADTIIVQHLLLGVNAHLSLDLAIHALRRDFLLINDIPARVVSTVQDSVGAMSPLMSLLDQVGGRTDEQSLDFSARQSREEAWYNAVLPAGQRNEERKGAVERLDIQAAPTATIHNGVTQARRTSSVGSCEPKSMRPRASAGGTATMACSARRALPGVWTSSPPVDRGDGTVQS